MGLSCIVSEIDSDFSRKSQIFPTPCILHPNTIADLLWIYHRSGVLLPYCHSEICLSGADGYSPDEPSELSLWPRSWWPRSLGEHYWSKKAFALSSSTEHMAGKLVSWIREGHSLCDDLVLKQPLWALNYSVKCSPHVVYSNACVGSFQFITLRASCSAVYYNRSCLCVCAGGCVCLSVFYHDNSKLRAPILTKLGL